MSSFATNIIYNSPLSFTSDDNVIYITDSNTSCLLKKEVGYSSNISHLELEVGEEHKSFESVEKILSFAIEHKIDREGTFVGIGGGVLLDVVGFASSIYMRGIASVYVPTTLLAMVDASIGGKTAINFGSFKNIVGTFYAPKEVYILEQYLESLSYAQYMSGLAEIIKISLINSPDIYKKIKHNVAKIQNRCMTGFIEIIKTAIEGKIRVIKKDFREKNIRAHLNLGHTFAHALEELLEFRDITHGEAVAWGISRALSLGLLLGKTCDAYARDVLATLENLGYETSPIPKALLEKLKNCNNRSGKIYRKEEIPNLFIEKMEMDKKSRHGKINFVLQENLGKTFIFEASKDNIKEKIIEVLL